MAHTALSTSEGMGLFRVSLWAAVAAGYYVDDAACGDTIGCQSVLLLAVL